MNNKEKHVQMKHTCGPRQARGRITGANQIGDTGCALLESTRQGKQTAHCWRALEKEHRVHIAGEHYIGDRVHTTGEHYMGTQNTHYWRALYRVMTNLYSAKYTTRAGTECVHDRVFVFFKVPLKSGYFFFFFHGSRSDLVAKIC